jgi:hypothetical protein
MGKINKKGKSTKNVSHVDLTEFAPGKNKDGIHAGVDHLVNEDDPEAWSYDSKIAGDRLTVIVTVPKVWGGSLSEQPGHAGVVLWNSSDYKYQSCGIDDGGNFSQEAVNVGDGLNKNDKFKIWYFTKKINATQYEQMRKRCVDVAAKKHGYGKFFVARGIMEDGSYSCVTAADTILCAANQSWGVGAQLSTPYAYAQTFTRVAWYISVAEGFKHV